MNVENIKIGNNAPKEFNVVIEIPQGSAVKYEIDILSGALKVDRFIGSASVYPFNYGFIPETLANDGDALDAMVISSLPVYPEAFMSCRPIGLLEMQDEHGGDTKILCVPVDEVDPFFRHVNDLKDIDSPTLERIKLFFKQYKELENERWSKVENFGNKKQAIAAIKEAIAAAKK